MTYAYEKLTEEDERAKKYLDNSQEDSYRRLIAASVAILVVQFQDQLLKEAENLIAQNETVRKFLDHKFLIVALKFYLLFCLIREVFWRFSELLNSFLTLSGNF